ncbi:MAG: DUF1080 domain-containing protein [Gemmatimonadetes bacterium]|nr:DUF1080 domain-containing protein [Gemmatimonadota bacterium]
MRKTGIVALALLIGGGHAQMTSAQAVNQLTAEEQRDGWQLLSDGSTMNGWTQKEMARWVVEDGAFVPVLNSGLGFLATNGVYENFHLRVDFWEDDVANGGVFLRTPAEGAINMSNAFEINIFDAHTQWPTGSINEFSRAARPNTQLKWNTYDITVEGQRVRVVLNGVPTAEIYATNRLSRGPIALQYVGAGVIRYRNVRIKTL